MDLENWASKLLLFFISALRPEIKIDLALLAPLINLLLGIASLYFIHSRHKESLKKSYSRSWYLDVIIKPQIDEIEQIFQKLQGQIIELDDLLRQDPNQRTIDPLNFLNQITDDMTDLTRKIMSKVKFVDQDKHRGLERLIETYTDELYTQTSKVNDEPSNLELTQEFNDFEAAFYAALYKEPN